MARRKGKLFIISAPSGSGKTTLCNRLVKSVPHIARSISLTTRPPRRGEEDGEDYIFVNKKEFKKRIRKKNLLEWAINYGHYYGTPRSTILKLLSRGTDVILAIDVKGAMKVKKLYPDGVFIFILPPSISELKNRLRKRKTDDHRGMSRRLTVAERELSFLPTYTYSVVNDNLKRAADKLKAIVIAERCKIRY